MSDAQSTASPEPAKPSMPDSIYLVSYPKIVYLYPTWIASLVAGIYLLIQKNQNIPATSNVALIFLGILALNMVVLSFDFPRTTSLTLFFFCVAVGVKNCCARYSFYYKDFFFRTFGTSTLILLSLGTNFLAYYKIILQ